MLLIFKVFYINPLITTVSIISILWMGNRQRELLSNLPRTAEGVCTSKDWESGHLMCIALHTRTLLRMYVWCSPGIVTKLSVYSVCEQSGTMQGKRQNIADSWQNSIVPNLKSLMYLGLWYKTNAVICPRKMFSVN